MPRFIVFLIIVLVVLIGGIALLSSSVDEVPVQRVEVDVSRDSNAN